MQSIHWIRSCFLTILTCVTCLSVSAFEGGRYCTVIGGGWWVLKNDDGKTLETFQTRRECAASNGSRTPSAARYCTQVGGGWWTLKNNEGKTLETYGSQNDCLSADSGYSGRYCTQIGGGWWALKNNEGKQLDTYRTRGECQVALR